MQFNEHVNPRRSHLNFSGNFFDYNQNPSFQENPLTYTSGQYCFRPLSLQVHKSRERNRSSKENNIVLNITSPGSWESNKVSRFSGRIEDGCRLLFCTIGAVLRDSFTFGLSELQNFRSFVLSGTDLTGKCKCPRIYFVLCGTMSCLYRNKGDQFQIRTLLCFFCRIANVCYIS